jgi:hypothetical protein
MLLLIFKNSGTGLGEAVFEGKVKSGHFTVSLKIL